MNYERPYVFPVEISYRDPVPGAVVRKVGRNYPGGKVGRKMPSRRPDPTKCMAGLHDWTPENIINRRDRPDGDGCRTCKNEKSAARKARERALDPVGRTNGYHNKFKVAANYVEYRELGYSFEEIAVKLEMTQGALAKSLYRTQTPR